MICYGALLSRFGRLTEKAWTVIKPKYPLNDTLFFWEYSALVSLKVLADLPGHGWRCGYEVARLHL